MAVFLQIVLINLVVSCDNVGVIALATRSLPPDKARSTRRLGIWLSLLLKLVFIGVTGFLFGIPWLHIRIIGGILLIYVTINMLRHTGQGQEHRAVDGNDSMLFALVSIIAADISMSLDNVIALLSIVSADGGAPTTGDMVMIFAGLVLSVPVLLWFSGAISRLMERYPILIYLCAGYLVYTAVRMVFEDETIVLFFKEIGFTFTTPAAVLFGALVVAAGAFTGGARGPRSTLRRRGLVALYFLVCLYAFMTVGVISYLSTGPVEDGVRLSVEAMYGFAPCGANAVHLLGKSPHLFALCAGAFVGIITGREERGGYMGGLGRSMLGMAVFLGLELLVTTVGLTVIFGFGDLRPGVWFGSVALQLLLHGAYVSVFCMVRAFVRSRRAMVGIAMLSILTEHILLDISTFAERGLFFAGFLPSYYIYNLPLHLGNGALVFRLVFVALLAIGASTWVGWERHGGRPWAPPKPASFLKKA